MKANSVVISINYAGMQLPVTKNSKGEDCTPLKPISDLFGLRWETQREKVTKSPYLSKFLGVCTLLMGGAGDQNREQTCILLSRVAAFMMSINPERVRVNGKAQAADFLEEKLSEWADALHDYEQLGVAFNMNHVRTREAASRQYMRVAQMLKIKSTLPNLRERRIMDVMIGRAAGELGISYQLDLLDEHYPGAEDDRGQ